MTNVKVLVFALAVLAIVGASFAGAQTPYVGVFSDRAAMRRMMLSMLMVMSTPPLRCC